MRALVYWHDTNSLEQRLPAIVTWVILFFQIYLAVGVEMEKKTMASDIIKSSCSDVFGSWESVKNNNKFKLNCFSFSTPDIS